MVRPVRVFAVAPVSEAVAQSALMVPEKPSIAVLPFENMSRDPEQDYFADGIVEEIITGLSRLRWLYVAARTSSFQFRGQALDVRDIAARLGVRYILEGSVRKGGDRIRITGQLIHIGPVPLVKDALTAIGVAVLSAGAYQLMGIVGGVIAFSGAMGQ